MAELIEDAIKANDLLKDLSEEQVKAVTGILGNQLGNFHRQIEQSVLDKSGIKKEGNEKSYDYMARAFDAMNEAATKSNADIATLKQQLKDAAPEQYKSQIDALSAENAKVKGMYNDLNKAHEDLKLQHKKDLDGFKLDMLLNEAMGSIKLQDMNAAVRSAVVSAAKAQVMAKNPIMENGTIVFKDANGGNVLNAQKGLIPMTATDMFTDIFKSMDVLYKENAGGAGGQGGRKGQQNKVVVNTENCKNITEAVAMIRTALENMGYKEGSDEYRKEFTRLYNENDVNRLPM